MKLRILICVFVGRPGLLVDLSDDKDPMEYLKLYFGDDYWQDLAFQTNLYADQDLTAANITPSSRKSRWQPVTPGELKVFFGLTVAMGLVRKDDVDKFWSTDECLETPFFR